MKIRKIQEILRDRGIDSEKLQNGVRINLAAAGTLDLYIFGADVVFEEIRAELSDEETDTEKTGKTQFFGCSDHTGFYCAKIRLKEESTEADQNNKYAEKALNQLHNVDSKMFRQGLDDLGLSRSGNVRLALSRIFRSSADAKELLASIAQEAARIATADEHDEMNKLKEKGHASFISAIKELLLEEVKRYKT